MRRAGTGNGHFAGCRVIERERHSDEAGIEARGVQTAIEHLQHFSGRARMIDDVLAQNADGERAVESSRRSFAGDITENEGEAAVAVGKEIVEVAAEFASGNVRRDRKSVV